MSISGVSATVPAGQILSPQAVLSAESNPAGQRIVGGHSHRGADSIGISGPSQSVQPPISPPAPWSSTSGVNVVL